MRRIALITIAAALGVAQPALASASNDYSAGDADETASDNAPYLQCVPYARQVSGIRIFGDAWTWWDQAEGRYARGDRPRVGAVMSFKAFGGSRLGHVAAVSRILDMRTVLIRHANWSPINGRRGQIEDDVRAVDVSEANDWSEVRVWFAPIHGLGTTRWPLNGFIYPDKPPRLDAPRPQWASVEAKPSRKPLVGADFLKGVNLGEALSPKVTANKSGKHSADPIGEILARVS